MEQTDLEHAAELAVINSDSVESVRLAHVALDSGMDVLSLVINGYSKGLLDIARRFDRNEVFYPQVMSSGRAAMSAIDVLDGYMRDNRLYLGTFVICSIANFHSVGKDMCSMLLRCSGFNVVDLGTEVMVPEIVDAVRRNRADFVATSAPVTSSLLYQKDLEEAMAREGLKGKCLTCVGGAACSRQWADEIGADIFSATFSELLDQALEIRRPD